MFELVYVTSGCGLGDGPPRKYSKFTSTLGFQQVAVAAAIGFHKVVTGLHCTNRRMQLRMPAIITPHVMEYGNLLPRCVGAMIRTRRSATATLGIQMAIMPKSSVIYSTLWLPWWLEKEGLRGVSRFRNS